ncbi:MAG: major facilitator superfamily domain-containing protein [Linnemannia elongata]|nr:MAG: major facilitator superfamily domain-containing protein [Linnemannia elongata]
MEDPVAVAAAHDAQESTPLLRGDINTTTNNHNDRRHETCHYYDDCDTPNWYWPWPAAYWAAIPVIFLAGLAVGPAMAMTSPLVKLLFCERGIPDLFKDKNRDHLLLSGDEKDCDSSEHSAAIAKFTGVFASLTSVLVTLTVRYWNSLSDRIGRKKTMLIWAVGTTVAQTFPVMVYYNKGMSVYFLWLAGMIEGAVGSILCLIALVHSYAADVSSPEQRTVVFGRMMAGWYAGLGIGSAIGGMVAKRFGMITVFWMLPVISFIDVLYVLMIPESLTAAKLAGNNQPTMNNSQSQATLIDVDRSNSAGPNNTSSSQPIKPATTLRHQSWVDRVVRACVPEQLPHRLGGKYSIIVLMITCFFALMSVMGAMYQSSVYLLYKFKWTGTELSYLGAIQGMSRLVSLTVLLPLIKKLAPARAKTNPAVGIKFDIKVMIMGLWLEALTMFIYAVAPIAEYFYVGGVTGAIGSLFFPATRGIISQSVAPEMLGKTLGTLATFESLAAVIAPSMYAWIYALTLKTHPSLVFYLATGVIMLSSGLAISVAIAHSNEMKRRA